MKHIYRQSFEALTDRMRVAYRFVWGATIFFILMMVLGILTYAARSYFLLGISCLGIIMAFVALADSSTEWSHIKERIAKEYPKRASEVLLIK
jgi:hypothetical protein